MSYIDDPKECKVVDCRHENANKLCPKTCAVSEHKVCTMVDCRLAESVDFCPITCGTPKEQEEQKPGTIATNDKQRNVFMQKPYHLLFFYHKCLYF